jgi:glycosyltransferase involved in cell wall biosynthesis
MSKLVIQIPCYNEEEELRATLDEIPKTLEGFDEVEIMIVDDGSTDATAEIAREYGGIHVVSLPYHMGLAKAFTAGIETALKRGADVILNTDADNQYCASSIPDLVQPILDGKAQMVIGARPVRTDRHMSPIKRALQVFGSWVVRQASGTDIADAPSGFRAIHRDAALRLFVYSNYTYTLETIIQAGRKNIPVVSVPVNVNPPTRPSRLVRSNLSYVWRSLTTILRILLLYKPLRSFLALALVLGLFAGVIGLRFMYFYFMGDGSGHVQSLLAGVALAVIAALSLTVGIVCDIIAANRLLLEDIRYRLLKQELENTHRKA